MSESINCVSVATIIPADSLHPNSPQPTMGTRVMLTNGSELTGITSITMTAEPGGVWKATITVIPHNVEPVTAEVMVVRQSRRSVLMSSSLKSQQPVTACVDTSGHLSGSSS